MKRSILSTSLGAFGLRMLMDDTFRQQVNSQLPEINNEPYIDRNVPNAKPCIPGSVRRRLAKQTLQNKE